MTKIRRGGRRCPRPDIEAVVETGHGRQQLVTLIHEEPCQNGRQTAILRTISSLTINIVAIIARRSPHPANLNGLSRHDLVWCGCACLAGRTNNLEGSKMAKNSAALTLARHLSLWKIYHSSQELSSNAPPEAVHGEAEGQPPGAQNAGARKRRIRSVLFHLPYVSLAGSPRMRCQMGGVARDEAIDK